ncbi:MAG: SpoIIE family protein phosphatase [Proteobacteria bacterium]|nr:SpoIIE family protein phosphatase [Pseudomonadota bacterium]
MPSDDYPERTIQLSADSYPDPLIDEAGTTLVVIAGAQVGRAYKLSDGPPVRLGRASDAEFQLRDTGVSRHHARLYPDEDNRWWIEDLRSTNGTYVNGSRITKTALQSGDHIKVGRALIHYQHRADKQALEQDREETAAIQSRLLPLEDTFERGDLHLAALYRPAAHTSGDWWWYDWRPADSLLVLLGDVTGHGQASAMVTAVVAGCLHTLKNTRRIRDPEELLRQINANLLTVCGGKYWMASVALEVDPATGKLHYWSAGAPSGLMLAPDGSVEVLIGQGTNLGQRMQMELGTGERDFRPGSRLLLYTDGITELETSDGRMFGNRRLTQLLQSTQHLSPVDARSAILTTLERSNHTAQKDDWTFVIVDRTSG